MKFEKFVGKTKDLVIDEALQTLNLKENEVIIKDIVETKNLFNKKCEIEVISKQEVNDNVKEFIVNILSLMGIEANLETKVRDEVLYLNIVSDNSKILIGKDGKNLDSLQTILNAYLKKELGFVYRINIDVCDYKKYKDQKLANFGKKLAKDVLKSKCPINLDPMNAYERRIIHNVVGEFKELKTESVGTEPNRYVVIKPKD